MIKTNSNSFSDIQSNLIDSKVGRHQATYIPVSNSLLKSSKTKTPSARPVSISKRIYHDRTTAPDDKNASNIINATNLRHKRELQDVTTVMDDVTKTTESTSTMSSTLFNESNEAADYNETYTMNNPDAIPNLNSGSKETTTDTTYPTFHVTYWMFYPYSQVKRKPFIQKLDKKKLYSKIAQKFFKKLGKKNH